MKIRYILLVLILGLISCGETPAPDKIEDSTIPPSMKEESKSKIEIIKLDESAVKNLNIKLYTVKESKAKYEFVVPASVLPSPDNINVISAPISGRISKIFKHEGDNVTVGEALLEIESIEFTNLVFDYLQSKNEVNIKKAQKDRLQKLSEQNINSQREFENSNFEYQSAVNNLNAAFSRLKAIGLTDSEINGFTDGKVNSSLTVRSKISGKINEHLIENGKSVTMYDKLLTVINAGSVMINGYIAPEDAEYISTGDEVVIYTLKENPANNINAKIHSINPALDDVNKSVVANIFAQTKAGFPKPGQTIRIKIIAGSEKSMIEIPSEGLLYEDSDAFVFVKKSDSEFIKTPVKIGFESDNNVYLLDGLRAGDEIAVSQIFTLKALSKYDEFAE